MLFGTLLVLALPSLMYGLAYHFKQLGWGIYWEVYHPVMTKLLQPTYLLLS